jgi:hypothetical protein
MPRQPLDRFGEGTEVVRVYFALGLEEAERAEALLDGAGLTFAVEVEEVGGPTMFGFGRPRRGAGLWIREGDLDVACAALEKADMLKGLVDRSEGSA